MTPRKRRNQVISFAQARADRLRDRCDWTTDCACRRKHDYLARRYELGVLFEELFPREFFDLRMSIFTMLSCMEHYPIQKSVRDHARRQLTSWVWSRVFDEPGVEEPE
jgi:hypothetical protein